MTTSFWRHVLPSLTYVALLFVGGSWPAGEGPSALNDKLVHFVAFIPLGALTPGLVQYAHAARQRQRSLLALLWASGAGAGLELWQAVLPHRSCEWLDWVADTLGAAIGVGLAHVFAARRQR